MNTRAENEVAMVMDNWDMISPNSQASSRPTDTEMLEYLMNTNAMVGRLTIGGKTQYRISTPTEVITDWYHTPREALAAAMFVEQNKALKGEQG